MTPPRHRHRGRGRLLARIERPVLGLADRRAAPRRAGTARLVFIPPDKVEQAERWSQRFGSFGIFLSRMLPVVRHLIGIPAGIVRMNYWKFSLYTILGSLIWCGVLTYVSFIAGKDERLMHGEIREVTLWAAGAATFLGAAYYFLVHRYTRREAQREARGHAG